MTDFTAESSASAPARPTTRERSRNASRDTRDKVTYDVVKHIGVLSTSSSGWTREVNLVSWNHRPARLDIRDWNPEHTKMSRGVGLNGQETLNLRALLRDFDVENSGI